MQTSQDQARRIEQGVTANLDTPRPAPQAQKPCTWCRNQPWNPACHSWYLCAMLTLFMLLIGCSVNHGVRPLGKGKTAINASVGGPTAELFGAPVPLPISTVGVRHGISDRSDIHAAFHPSMALLFGVAGLDAGASYLVFEQEGPRPAILVDGTVTAIFGDLSEGEPAGGFRMYGNVAALASWEYGQRGNLVYTGADLFIQPSPWQPIGGPLIGHQLRLGERVGLSTELKWMGGSANTDPFTIRWYGIGQQGVLVPQIGLDVAFGDGQ